MPSEASLEALIDELAQLAAELWFEGELELPTSEENADGKDEA